MTQPLAGRTVLVTRPAHQAAPLVQLIEAAGGTVFEFPALAVEAVDASRLTCARHSRRAPADMTQPLAGRTVLVTRPAHQAAPLVQLIEAAGGTAFEFPALAVEAVDAGQLTGARSHLAEADGVIFISPNAAQFGMAAIGALPATPATLRVFAVGLGTARALAAHGVTDVITPDGQDSEALLALPALQDVAGKRVVIVRGVGGRPLLADTLVARGAQVHYLECYRRTCPQADAAPLRARWQAGGVDAVTIASAETLHNLAALLGETGAPLLASTPLFAPHEKIAAAARRFGIASVIATPGGDAGLVAGLINWFGTIHE